MVHGLKYIRSEQLNKTMEELAQDLGVSKQSIYLWESEKKKIPEKRLVQLEKISGIPQKYFVSVDVSERDKMEINRYRLNKELEDSAFEYEDTVYDQYGDEHVVSYTHMDTGLLEHVDLNDMEIKTDDLLTKIKNIVTEFNPILEEDEFLSINDVLNHMSITISVFDRFADIVYKNKETTFLYQVIRAMELFFGSNVDRNQIYGEIPPFPTDLVSDDSLLVQDLVSLLRKHKNEEIKEAEEIANLFDDET